MKYLLKFALLLFFFASCEEENGSPMLRIKNVDSIDFEEVIVRNTNFGALAAGATSEYKAMEKLYRYDYIELITNNGTCIFQPIDFVGETAYTMGKFRYDIKRNIIPQFEDCFVELEFVEE